MRAPLWRRKLTCATVNIPCIFKGVHIICVYIYIYGERERESLGLRVQGQHFLHNLPGMGSFFGNILEALQHVILEGLGSRVFLA